MEARHLAEAIILQAIEDLGDMRRRGEALKFFKGKEFDSCAESAGMNGLDQYRLFKMIGRLLENAAPVIHVRRAMTNQKRFQTSHEVSMIPFRAPVQIKPCHEGRLAAV